MRSTKHGSLYMLLASLLWSLGGLGIQLIPWGPLPIIGLRAVLAAGVFSLFMLKTSGRVRIRFTKGNVLAGLCLSSTTILYVFANKLTTAAAAILLQFTSPIFILILGFLMFRQRPRRSDILVVAVTFLGMALFFLEDLGGSGLLGNLLAVASGLSFAGVFMFNRLPDADPQHSLMIGFLFDAAIGLPFVFTQVTADPVAWMSVIVLGLFQVGLAYVFFSIGIRSIQPLQACLITALEPVLNPVWVMLFTRQTPGLYTVAGGLVILAAVVSNQIIQARHTASRGAP